MADGALKVAALWIEEMERLHVTLKTRYLGLSTEC